MGDHTYDEFRCAHLSQERATVGMASEDVDVRAEARWHARNLECHK